MTTFTNARPKTMPQRGFRASPDRPLALLARCPVHIETPMPELADLTRTLGVAQLFAKNEGKRMRLGSFKALGGAFAVAQMICEAAGVEDPMAAKDTAATMTFVTASAGNHGLSVAAGAKVFGARAVIILPSTAPAAFAARIRATGAEVIGGESYDDSVAQAIRLADENGWIHLSDGSWTGYTLFRSTLGRPMCFCKPASAGLRQGLRRISAITGRFSRPSWWWSLTARLA
jgi:diaminopropionate ammonia-lyase